MAVRLSGKDSTSEMVLDRDVIINESCVYSVCASSRVGVAFRLCGEVGPAAMVLAGEVCNEFVCVSVVNSSDELSGLMSSVEIDDFNCRTLKDTVELSANVCSCVVEPALDVDVAFDWPISEAELVCVKMDTVDVCLSDRVVDVDLMYTELEISIDDMYID